MIYLASPYSDPDRRVMKQRARANVLAAAHLIHYKGLHLYAPIVHSPQIAAELDKFGVSCYNFEYWRHYDIDILRRCDGLYVLKLDGWDTSIGVAAEIAVALAINLPVTYVDAMSYELTHEPKR